MIHPSVLQRMLPTILPLAVAWITSVEKDLQAHSRFLSANEVQDAICLGVRHPDMVRVANVEKLPEPSDELNLLARQLRILTPDTPSLTYGSVIAVRRDMKKRPEALLHGLVHIAQIERCGGLRSFLRDYLESCLEFGLEMSPFEIEARTKVAGLLESHIAMRGPHSSASHFGEHI